MSQLILDSLEVKGFRAFRDLQIPHLGRVNLIIGKNNSGKTSLLEALRLYANRSSASLMWELASVRDETNRSLGFSGRSELEVTLNTLSFLFHNRPIIMNTFPSIQIGPLNASENALSIEFSVRGVGKQDGTDLSKFFYDPISADAFSIDNLYIIISLGTNMLAGYVLNKPFEQLSSNFLPRIGTEPITNVYVQASGLNSTRINQLWSSVVLTNYEEDIIKALRIIAPDVRRVALQESNYNGGVSTELFPIVRLQNVADRIPLRSLGDGMSRIFGIALALVNSSNGILMIDEIESGLHYSVQSDMWRLVFETARRLNVQVFATTHSWDCIQAFQRAAEEDKESEGVLIRLNNRNGEITTTLFNEDELQVVTDQQIEVR